MAASGHVYSQQKKSHKWRHSVSMLSSVLTAEVTWAPDNACSWMHSGGRPHLPLVSEMFAVFSPNACRPCKRCVITFSPCRRHPTALSPCNRCPATCSPSKRCPITYSLCKRCIDALTCARGTPPSESLCVHKDIPMVLCPSSCPP